MGACALAGGWYPRGGNTSILGGALGPGGVAGAVVGVGCNGADGFVLGKYGCDCS
jgi:hypothetical protein